MGKQARAADLLRKSRAEYKEEMEDLPAEKIGERPMAGLCCKTCSLTVRFSKLEVPRRGKLCGHPVFLENATLCARCALTADGGPLCRACGKNISGLLEEERQAAKKLKERVGHIGFHKLVSKREC